MGEESKSHHIRLILAYDGSRYHGWQRQKNGLTIQEILEDKIGIMAGETVTVIGSGRTDAGVHALNQTCHFKTRSPLGPDVFKKGLNSLLPDDIFIRNADTVSPDFHARYSARRKTYEYRILNREAPDVFQRAYVWHIKAPLDIKAMRQCLGLLVGEHDFSSFRSTGSGNTNPVRNVLKAGILGPEDGLLRLVIQADGFLRHMVRNIVGTLVDVGLGKSDFETFRRILESGDRALAGVKAPSQGLFLVGVEY